MHINQTHFEQLSKDYIRVEQAIDYLENNAGNQPALCDIAKALNLSEYHFQKLFSRWVGISPKRFLQYVTKEHAKRMLENSRSVLDASYDSGLSGPGRLHDLFISCEAITPGEYKTKGRGLVIKYGFSPTPFGNCLLASTKNGICNLKFVNGKNEKDLFEWLAHGWQNAKLVKDNKNAEDMVKKIFDFNSLEKPAPIHLFIRGTNFQIKVWEALAKIPFGQAVTYQDIANHIGLPKANRAVGTAIGKNPIPFLIPCHRVIRKLGDFGNYGEGPLRKKALIGFETALAQQI